MEIFLSLKKYPALCKLKLLGALKHPDEAVFHFSLLFLQMPSSSDSILNHIKEYLIFISDAQSFWYTLNTSYNHDFHLASRFRLEPNDYEVLLIVAGLALNMRFGFAIKPTARRKFLSGHRFAVHNRAIKFEQKKIDLDAYINGAPLSEQNQRKFYVVRVGNKTEQSPNKIEEQMGRDGQLITAPPRLNGLGLKQQSIIRIVEPFIWNIIVENDDKDDKDAAKDKEDSSNQKSTSAPSHSLGSPPAAGTTAISPATSSMSSNKKRKLNVGTSNNNDNNVQTLYPHLSCTLRGENDGFDMTNPSVLKSMQALLTELTHIFSTKYELKVKDKAKVGHEISYVRIPRTSSD